MQMKKAQEVDVFLYINRYKGKIHRF